MRLVGLFLCALAVLAPHATYAGPQDVHPFYDVSLTLRNLNCANWFRAVGTDGRPLSPEMFALYWKRKQADDTRAFLHVPDGKPVDLEHPFVAIFDESSNFFLGKMTPATADPFDAYFGGHFRGPTVHSTESVGRFWRDERLGFMVMRGSERDPKDQSQFAVQTAFPEGIGGETIVANPQRCYALRGEPDVPRRVIGFELGAFPFDPLEIISGFLRWCDPFDLGAIRRDVPEAGLLCLDQRDGLRKLVLAR